MIYVSSFSKAMQLIEISHRFGFIAIAGG